MLLRLYAGIVTCVFLMLLVELQAKAAGSDGFLTVEQIMNRHVQGLTFDRHYAMVLDFCIIAPFCGLSMVLCGSQWNLWHISAAISIAIIITAIGMWFWSTLPTPEVHHHNGRTTLAGWGHGIYMVIALTVLILVLCFTHRPEPVLLLMLCIILPAFLFVSQQLYLAMLNSGGAASTYPDNPLRFWVPWTIIIVVFAGVSLRSYFLIPPTFWANLN